LITGRVVSLISVTAMMLAGCGSAGGTADIFDIGSVWYKHPATGDVKECGGGFYPGVQIRRYNCGKRRLAEGYAEVEKCKEVSPGTLCVTDDDIERAERAERGGFDPAAQLRELKRLHEQGLISDQEYDTKRQQILDRL
jgi:hypothetical protein